MITVIDYGMGNLKSIVNAFKALNQEVRLTDRPQDIAAASAVILPGVGAFADGMQNLRKLGLLEAVEDAVRVRRVPYLGICLGMQFLADVGHEFGVNPGFGWLKSEVVRIQPKESSYKVPHMGWNDVSFAQPDSPLCKGLKNPTAFYFVHSYHLVPAADARASIVGTADHGGEVVSMVAQDNIFGVQFHPEKSQGAGLTVLANFLEYARNHA
jgi:imidazole glycerol-phosphate synthase subunit HisH